MAAGRVTDLFYATPLGGWRVAGKHAYFDVGLGVVVNPFVSPRLMRTLDIELAAGWVF